MYEDPGCLIPPFLSKPSLNMGPIAIFKKQKTTIAPKIEPTFQGDDPFLSDPFLFSLFSNLCSTSDQSLGEYLGIWILVQKGWIFPFHQLQHRMYAPNSNCTELPPEQGHHPTIKLKMQGRAVLNVCNLLKIHVSPSNEESEMDSAGR